VRLFAILVVMVSCARKEPPGAAPPSASVAPASVSATPTTVDAAPPPSAPDASAPDAAEAAVDAGALPQTHDKPEASGPAFDARVQALWDAIASDDPDRAMPFFFPVAAYEQVKAIANPSRDWKNRLVGAYARDIQELHKKVGQGAKLVRFEAGPAPRWVEPGEEWNKIGYWRVFGSRMRFERDGGRADSFEVKSLISWRGEWYVVHLSAIK
jgi:hypothetical protein